MLEYVAHYIINVGVSQATYRVINETGSVNLFSRQVKQINNVTDTVFTINNPQNNETINFTHIFCSQDLVPYTWPVNVPPVQIFWVFPDTETNNSFKLHHEIDNTGAKSTRKVEIQHQINKKGTIPVKYVALQRLSERRG